MIHYTKNDKGQCIAGIIAAPTNDNRFVLYVLWEFEHAAKEGRFKGYKLYSNVDEIDTNSIRQVMDWGKPMSKEEYEKYFPFVVDEFHKTKS